MKTNIINKVKKLKRSSIVKTAGVLAMCLPLSSALTSCSDYLNVEPLEQITLENFWTEKADVENMIAGCYERLQQQDVIDRMMIWGEVRSDNIMAGRNVSNILNLSNIFKENINSNNEFCNWLCFYNVINRCNIVIKYAPEVAQKDPNFKQGDLNAAIAEVSTIRDICYFYLIRAFRDVPYYTEPYTDDDQRLSIPATPFDQVLDALIADMENVAANDWAVNKYPETKSSYQTGRITRNAVYALLADMYLWKGDWDNCIKYADKVIDSKKSDYKENMNRRSGAASVLGGQSMASEKDLKDFNYYPLINDNSNTSASGDNGIYGQAYTSIFGNGGSSETIFELIYSNNTSMVSNSAITSRYGNSNVSEFIGNFQPSEYVSGDVTNNLYKVFAHNRDTRFWENIYYTSGDCGINKYASSIARVQFQGQPTEYLKMISRYSPGNCYANWIIYRLSDVMLMKAEALTMKVDSTAAGVKEVNDSLLRTAIVIVNALERRSYGGTSFPADSFKLSSYNNRGEMESLVLAERQRELMFEGKRWFDLVRMARRAGNTQRLVDIVGNKYTENKASAMNKLSKMDAIYWPYAQSELERNPYLKQNPAFNSGTNDNYSLSSK